MKLRLERPNETGTFKPVHKTTVTVANVKRTAQDIIRLEYARQDALIWNERELPVTAKTSLKSLVFRIALYSDDPCTAATLKHARKYYPQSTSNPTEPYKAKAQRAPIGLNERRNYREAKQLEQYANDAGPMPVHMRDHDYERFSNESTPEFVTVDPESVQRKEVYAT